MKSNEQDTIGTWDQLDFYLENLKTLMQIWDDFLHQFCNRPDDLEVRDRYLETLHIATSCVVNKAIELREQETAASLEEPKWQGLGVVKISTED